MSLASTLLDLVYPRQCAGCGEAPTGESGHVCWDCLAGLRLIGAPFCDLCGDPAEGRVEHEFCCSSCVRKAPAFDRARSAARYRGTMRAILQSFKYGRETCLAADLVRLLDACVRTHYDAVRFDGVAFVPLHTRRERSRTYNQARLLARGLARCRGLPLLPAFLRRIRPTGSQTALKSAARRTNVRGAFAVADSAWVEGRRLLLVDDIMTTGATVNECARTLKAAGALGVYVVTVARG